VLGLVERLVELRSSKFLPHQCTEVRFACFLSSGFITATVVNPPERKLAKRTYVAMARQE
jgi:hypothetical protein